MGGAPFPRAEGWCLSHSAGHWLCGVPAPKRFYCGSLRQVQSPKLFPLSLGGELSGKKKLESNKIMMVPNVSSPFYNSLMITSKAASMIGDWESMDVQGIPKSDRTKAW